MEITARRYQDGDAAWITLAAETVPPVVPPAETPPTETPPAAAAPEDESAADQPDAGEVAADDATDADAEPSPDAEAAVSAEEEADLINARHARWQYRIPDYKANLLARRWTDILKAED